MRGSLPPTERPTIERLQEGFLMNRYPTAKIAALVMGILPMVPGTAQDIFTTEDFRADREHWADPAYYRNNTVFEIRDMDRDSDFGEEGTGRVGAADLASPYPYTSAWEHYQAWLAEANGGTRHTRESIPDWSGRYGGGWDRLDGGPNPASSVVPMLKPRYQEAFVQDMVALGTGRTWGANAFCFPGGFATAIRDAEEFIVLPHRVWILSAGNNRNYIRWIYTDGSGHTQEDFQYPKWHGESIGFWDGDTLVVHTNQVRGWKGALTEFSDALETVERYRRVGDTIEGEITLYDPEVLVRPAFSRLAYELDTDTRPELRPLYNSCTDSNGPAPKIHMDERGILNERLQGDPLYWDATDPRPWATWLNESDERYRRYREGLDTSDNESPAN